MNATNQSVDGDAIPKKYAKSTEPVMAMHDARAISPIDAGGSHGDFITIVRAQ